MKRSRSRLRRGIDFFERPIDASSVLFFCSLSFSLSSFLRTSSLCPRSSARRQKSCFCSCSCCSEEPLTSGSISRRESSAVFSKRKGEEEEKSGSKSFRQELSLFPFFLLRSGEKDFVSLFLSNNNDTQWRSPSSSPMFSSRPRAPTRACASKQSRRSSSSRRRSRPRTWPRSRRSWVASRSPPRRGRSPGSS